jgi:hypothetical protein
MVTRCRRLGGGPPARVLVIEVCHADPLIFWAWWEFADALTIGTMDAGRNAQMDRVLTSRLWGAIKHR